MALSKASRAFESVLRIGSLPSESNRAPAFSCPNVTLYTGLDNSVISMGPETAKPKPVPSCEPLDVVHFVGGGSAYTASFTIARGVLQCAYSAYVLRRKVREPFSSLKDLFFLDTKNVHFHTLASGNCMPIFAGDILIFPVVPAQLHRNVNHVNLRASFDVKEGHEVLVLLPKITDMDQFQRNVLGNASVLNEMRNFIDECVGCWDAVYDPVSGITNYVWADDRCAHFESKAYDHLADVDSIYAGAQLPPVATGKQASRKRKVADSA